MCGHFFEIPCKQNLHITRTLHEVTNVSNMNKYDEEQN